MTVPPDSSVSALEAKLVTLQEQLVELEKKYKVLAENSKPNADGAKDKPADPTDLKSPIGPQVGPPVGPPIGPPNGAINANADKELPSPHSRVKIIKRTQDPDTGERIERPEESPTATQPEDAGKHAFVVKKIMHDKFSGEEDTSEIDIISLDLWELLKEHLGDYPYHLYRGSPTTLYAPYEAIIFGWDKLKNAASETPKNNQDKQAREDLQLLLDFISGGSSGDARLDRYFKVRDVCLQESTIQFECLWTIFSPGTLIYGKPFQNQDQLFIVQDNQATWPERGDRPQQVFPWKLNCWTYDWTGEQFQRTCFTLPFEQFEGHRPVTALPFFPFALHPEKQTVEEGLLKRGVIFRKLCTAKEGSRMFEYKGDSIFGKKGFSGLVPGDDDDSESQNRNSILDYHPVGSLRRHRSTIDIPKPMVAKSSWIDSRVMIDYLSYFQYGPPFACNGALLPNVDTSDCMCSDCQQNQSLAAKYRTRFDTVEAQKKWEKEQYMLCPPRVLGYILRDKQWAQLQVGLVAEIPPDDPGNAWNSRLRLADDNKDGNKTKDLLFDLVRSHISSNPNQAVESREMSLEVDDIIPGKGKGLVILLYGPPGVGKTSTAETIAVATRKPLFSISVADVGTKARHVESNLSRIFTLATSWQAILLIDEADVFLESRGRGPITSMDKNALVSVFLRVLEYYQGIMFLTTNQIAQFDVAIPSRIHVAIQYESLKAPQMEQIFKGFIEPLDNDGLVDDYEGILDWLREDVYNIGFDGRQIRNIVTTALGLARAELKYKRGKGKLSKKHLKGVVHNARSFKADFMVQYDRYISAQEKMIK